MGVMRKRGELQFHDKDVHWCIITFELIGVLLASFGYIHMIVFSPKWINFPKFNPIFAILSYWDLRQIFWFYGNSKIFCWSSFKLEILASLLYLICFHDQSKIEVLTNSYLADPFWVLSRTTAPINISPAIYI